MIFLLALVASLSGCLAATDREGLVSDFDALALHLAASYANLDECARRDALDLPALHDAARGKIASAATALQAERALEEFLASFRDPHLRLVREQDGAADGDGSRDPGDDPEAALDALGFTTRDLDTGPDFSALDGFERLDDDGAFPSGIVPLDDGARLGVIRIADFRPTVYREVALEVYPGFRSRHPVSWDEPTRWSFEDHVANALLARLAARVAELERRGATVLLVDVTRNGGGTSWCDPAARVLTPIELAPPRVAFTRHPHWSTYFADERARLEEIAARTDLSPQARDRVSRELARMETCLAESLRVPDRSRIWVDGASAVPPLLYAGDAIRQTPAPLAIARELGEVQFEYAPGAWNRNAALFVVMDDDTASASEYFVAMLRDNSAAVLLGERTMGAGQGYTRGGTPCRLERFARTVKLPDSSRLRGDGRPELDGIEPDVLCPFSRWDSRGDRARKTIEALRTALAR